MPVLFTLDLAIIGLLLGAIAAAASWRLPRGLNLLRGRSRCPRCDEPLRRRDIVPVLSWFLLGARCRNCRLPVSARYPLIETCCGIAGGVLGAGLSGSWIGLAVVLVGGAALLLAIRRRWASVSSEMTAGEGEGSGAPA